MWIKAILAGTLTLGGIALFLGLVPLGTRSAQDDIKGGDKWVIDVRRPHHIIPREFHSQGGMNPIDFWSYAPDPSFDANRTYFHDFVDESGITRSAAVQGVQINRTYSDPAYREEIMAIRRDGDIFEYSVPDFPFFFFSTRVGFRFLGQNRTALFYFYPFGTAHGSQDPAAIVEITLPLVNDTHSVVLSNDVRAWARMIEKLRNLPPAPTAFAEICSDRFQTSVRFAEALWGTSCPDNPRQ